MFKRILASALVFGKLSRQWRPATACDDPACHQTRCPRSDYMRAPCNGTGGVMSASNPRHQKCWLNEKILSVCEKYYQKIPVLIQ